VKVKVANEHSNDKVRIKVKHINELEDFDDKVRIKIKLIDELEHFHSELEGKVEKLQSNVMWQNSKLKSQEGEGEKKNVDYINHNFKYRNFLGYCWIQKSTRPSYGASSSRRGMFQMTATQQSMRYIPIAWTTTNDVDLIWEKISEFYNLIISNHILKSHVIQFYPDLTYFLESWFDDKRHKVVPLIRRNQTSFNWRLGLGGNK